MILFDRGPSGGPQIFDRPRALIRAETAGEVAAALEALEAARADGLWTAGYASYELGYALEPRLAPLMPAARRVPLLLFGVFEGPVAAPGPGDPAGARLSPPRPALDAAAYDAAIGRVLDYIRAGDCYQVNLTMRMRAEAGGDLPALYAALGRRQPVPHGAFLDLGAGPVVLSRSPELFFRTTAEDLIETRPMKGTRPRDADPARDAALAAELAASEKDRAENLMIVDLLRNDLSRLCEVGSVRVPELYRVESLATVHQMVSHVTGRLRPGTGLGAIFRALMPCGSVTGAPKIRAMEIIRELEPEPRGVYCGAIGWAAPDGRAEFNVAIRTLTVFAGGEAELGVGGGVVADSTGAGEYEEALWKARFAHLT